MARERWRFDKSGKDDHHRGDRAKLRQQPHTQPHQNEGLVDHQRRQQHEQIDDRVAERPHRGALAALPPKPDGVPEEAVRMVGVGGVGALGGPLASR